MIEMRDGWRIEHLGDECKEFAEDGEVLATLTAPDGRRFHAVACHSCSCAGCCLESLSNSCPWMEEAPVCVTLSKYADGFGRDFVLQEEQKGAGQ